MIPEKRDVITTRARGIGLSRVIGGYNYHSGVEAGRMLAVACAVKMHDNPEFLEDFKKARKEVRKVLGLPF